MLAAFNINREKQPPPWEVEDAVTRVQEKGQVTIPVAFRKILRIGKGARVKFSLNEEGQVIITPVVVRNALSVVESYLEENDISLEDLDQITESVQDRLFEELYGTP